uniref:Putative cuticle protein n=1 Tax=Amblyomma parvum TaxID=251391 RepID=A0A023FY51_AMBPA
MTRTGPAGQRCCHLCNVQCVLFQVLLCCLVAYAAGQALPGELPATPYSFSHDNTDEFGTRITREETSDENNNKVGSYSYTDPNGITRTVRYVADADGFRVTVETNEPGTKTSNPADAPFYSNAVEPPPAPAAPRPTPTAAIVRPVPRPYVVQSAPVVHTLHATPVALHATPFAIHAAPISYGTVHHATPVTVGGHPIAISHAPLTYTLGRAKS